MVVWSELSGMKLCWLVLLKCDMFKYILNYAPLSLKLNAPICDVFVMRTLNNSQLKFSIDFFFIDHTYISHLLQKVPIMKF